MDSIERNVAVLHIFKSEATMWRLFKTNNLRVKMRVRNNVEPEGHLSTHLKTIHEHVCTAYI